jgi:hypothetical protein
LRLGKTGRVPYVLSTGIPSEISAYLKLEYGIVDDDCYDAAKKKVMSNLRTLPGSQLRGGKYVAPFTSRLYLHGRGLTGCSEDTTVSQYVSRFPDRCQWLHRQSALVICADGTITPPIAPGSVVPVVSWTTPGSLSFCLARAIQRFHGHSPSPYVLPREVFRQEMMAPWSPAEFKGLLGPY